MEGPPPTAIHEDQQPVCQVRMENIVFAADPEEVVQRRVFQARKWPDGFTQEERYFLASFKELLKESSTLQLPIRFFGGLHVQESGNEMIGHRLAASFFRTNPDCLQKCLQRSEERRVGKE